MLAEINVATYVNPKAIIVNFGSILNDSEGDYLMVIRENKIKKVKVIKGESYNGKAEIIDGLLLDDQIITAGFDGLQEGDEFKIVSNN